MIKTHKPRGHFWVGASVFQRSKEIRKITFEDCTPPEDEEVLYPDPDEDLSTNEGSVKRRRIEQLADDFLNGKPLTIQAARPHCQSLKVAIEYNERSRTGKQYVLKMVREKKAAEAGVWEDVDELTKSVRPSTAQRSRSKGKGRGSGKLMRAASKTQAMEKEQASSACCQGRHRNVKVTLDPSATARKQAAASQTRGLEQAATETPLVSEMIHESTPEAVTHCDPSTTARPRYFRNRKPPSTEWLLRQNTALYELKADESFDELTRSPLDSTPSRASQKPKAEYASVRGGAFANEKGVFEPCSTDDLAKSQGQGLQRPVAISEVVQERSGDDDVMCGDMVADLTAPSAVVSECGPDMHGQGIVPGDNEGQARSSNASECRKMNSRTARVNNPADVVQPAAPRPEYTALASSNENGTPFKFRKRRTRANPYGEPAVPTDLPAARRTRRQRKTLQHPALPTASANDKPAAPPVLDMSISHDSSFGIRLNMALMDEHMNTILPTNPIRDGRTSSVKKALKREMRDAGADISSAEGKCRSSQGDASVLNQDSAIKAAFEDKDAYERAWESSKAADEGTVTQWPGTQVALYQAQRDLFPSPVKAPNRAGDTEYLIPRRSDPPASAPPTNPPARPPLRELSQEQQLPSTQVLMGSWSPWSAIKMSKNGTNDMRVPSPSARLLGVGKAAKSSRLSIIDSEPATSFDLENQRRRSSLRFSTTFDGLDTPKMQLQVTKSASQGAQRSSGGKEDNDTAVDTSSSATKETKMQSDHGSPISMSLDLTTAADAAAGRDQACDLPAETHTSSSMPAGQAQAVIPFRDDSQPERTIAELTEDVLGSARELDGIAGQ